MKPKNKLARLLLIGILVACVSIQAEAQTVKSVKDYSSLIKSYVYKDYKLMFRKGGGALKYPFLTPGSNQYANVLWDWD